jgi:hypothetical protein
VPGETSTIRIAEELGPASVPFSEALGGAAALNGLWLGQAGPLRLEVLELTSAAEPTVQSLRAAWHKRRARRAVPLIVFWQGEHDVLMTEPVGEPTSVPIVNVAPSAALAILQRALKAAQREVVSLVLSLLERTQGSAGIAGFRNRNLLSTHYATKGYQRDHKADWQRLSDQGATVRMEQGGKLLRTLGYAPTSHPSTFEVVAGDSVRVEALVLPEGTAFDRSPAGPGDAPATRLLVDARAKGAKVAVIVAGRLLRIYLAAVAQGLDDVTTASTYIELDLDILADEWSGLLPLLFAAESHQPNGLFDQLVQESSRYAIALRSRFRDRIYDTIVGGIAQSLFEARGRRKVEADILYQATLRLLYRLLFVLYAEDRNLLPLGNPEYRRISLTQTLFQLEERTRAGKPFDPRQTTLWDDMFRIFDAIRGGSVEWNIPAYNGGLFEPAQSDHPEAAYLHSVKIPNAKLAPLLLELAFDREDGQRGKVDFGDLGVRHLGTLYEGLLSYSVRVADADLALDRDGLYVPAKAKDTPIVAAGDVYVTSPKGGRKASGSHYTPTFVVRRLLENALAPVLERHLEEVAKRAPDDQWEAMLAFHVVDPAMGSGHFLVDALDVIANRFARYLAENRRIQAAPIKAAREQITAIGKAYGIESLGETIGDFELLRRIVMRNCVYGVDLNPMAVELAKLSLWLHAFVPGLPLSFLGHNLRFGNALVGVIGPEITVKLAHGAKGLFEDPLSEALTDALEQAKKLAALGDLSLDEVKKSERAQDALEVATTPIKNAFDAYSCRVFATNEDLDSRAEREMGKASLDSASGLVLVLQNDTKGEQKKQIARALSVAKSLHAFHWQLAFPEVFMRDRPGFDVVLGNPPWEEITVERLGFFTLHIPGLKSFASQTEQERIIKSYEKRHPEAAEAYRDEVASKEELREIVRANYTLARSGDPDLYRAFAELALNIVRPDGAMGMVYPRTLLSADGTAPFRERLLKEMSATVDFALNSGGWVFASAEPRYTIVALAGIKDEGGVLESAGPATSERDWSRLPSQRIRWTYDELKKASPGLEVPLNADQESAKLFHKIVVNGQPFESPLDSVQFRPWRPIDATQDRKSGVLKERSAKSKGWPVVGGRNFNLWEPDLGETDFVLDQKNGIEMLQRKRQRSDVWSEFSPKIISDPQTLPQFKPYIAFRDVARRNDSRTVIAALLPPERFTLNNAPLLVQRGGEERDLALRLGVMSSLPFDWVSRRRVESHVNFFILNALSVPSIGLDTSLGQRATNLAARLASPDARFADFARACGVSPGNLAKTEKDDMIAELDALVAAMYGLVDAELETIFRDFTVDAVPEARREATRSHFRRLAKVAIA